MVKPMTTRRAVAAGVAALLGALACPSALAQGGPLSLSPPPPAPPAPAGQAAAPAETPQQLVAQVNRALNGLTSLQAEFRQTNPDGRQRTGQLYVLRPGRLRFVYNPPSGLEVIADGSSVAVLDKRLATQDLYGIEQTPLKFLTRERIDLARDLTLVRARREGDAIVLDLEDKNTLGGTSRLRLVFDGTTAMIREWRVTDPQGQNTTVRLSQLDTGRPPPRSMFVINPMIGVNPSAN